MISDTNFYIQKYEDAIKEIKHLKMLLRRSNNLKYYYKGLSSKPRYMPLIPNRRVK